MLWEFTAPWELMPFSKIAMFGVARGRTPNIPQRKTGELGPLNLEFKFVTLSDTAVIKLMSL